MHSTLSLKKGLALLLVGFIANVSGTEKQYASKGRKEAPPFIIIDTPPASTYHHPLGPIPPGIDHSPTGVRTTSPEPPGAISGQSDPDRNPESERQEPAQKVPYFLIFHIPRIVPPDRDPDYGWDPWSDWSPCPAECGVQSRSFRIRHCGLPPVEAPDCDGENLQWKQCDLVQCNGGGGGSMAGSRDSRLLPAEVERVTGRSGGRGRGGADLEKEAKGNPDAWNLVMAKEYTVNSASAGEGADEYGSDQDGDQPGLWRPCVSPCPFEIHLRQRWCYLGQYCTGDRKEARVCTQLFGQLACGYANVTNADSNPGEGGGPGNDRPAVDPWTDPRFGWSSWTAWSVCPDDCCYHVQVLNTSVACPGGSGGGDCAEGRKNELRICWDGTGSTTSVTCGSVEKLTSWKLTEEIKSKKSVLVAYRSHVFHGIVVLVLLAPLLVLCLYWLVTKARRPRYEALSSSVSASVHANSQSTISTDASSAVGPNHLLVKDTQDAWKTI